MHVLVGPIVTCVGNAFPRFPHIGHGPQDLNETMLCTVIKTVKYINAG